MRHPATPVLLAQDVDHLIDRTNMGGITPLLLLHSERLFMHPSCHASSTTGQHYRRGTLTGMSDTARSDVPAVCRVTWTEQPVVEILNARNDEDLLAAMRTADKTGLDSTIGWPVAFTSLLAAHQAGARLPARSRCAPHGGRDGLVRLTHCLTDDVAWKRAGVG